MLPWLLAAMAAAACLFAVAAVRARVRAKGAVLAIAASALFFVYISAVFPVRHRIYLDEDAYANMALNVGAGFPGHTTQWSLPGAKRTMHFKWPVAFPTFMLPLVRWLGPETGPVVFNRLCGVATAVGVMMLAMALGGGYVAAAAGAILFALQPVAVAWYSSGSSDPLSALVCLGALAAAWLAQQQAERNYWPSVAILLAGIALHARLENVLLAAPVLLLLYLAPKPFARTPAAIAWVLSAAAVVHAARHYAVLPGFYLANIADSSFSLGLFVPNLISNFQFVVRQAATTGLLAVAAVVVAVARLTREQGRARLAGILLVFPLASSFLLLFYSVGQYDAPGESRFLLIAAPVLSALVASEIGILARGWGGRAACGVFLAALFVMVSRWPSSAAYLDRQWSTIAFEHDTMVRWAQTLPKNAVVVSRMPYFWENFGLYSALSGVPLPEETRGLPVYFYFGIASNPGEWPTGKIPERRVVTEAGALCLFRLQ